jgi:hypothetical protein
LCLTVFGRLIWAALAEVLTRVGRDGGFPIDFGFDIEISFGYRGIDRRHHRSPTSANRAGGADPEALSGGPELAQVPLCLRAEASHFWIILLLILSEMDHAIARRNQDRGDKASVSRVRISPAPPVLPRPTFSAGFRDRIEAQQPRASPENLRTTPRRLRSEILSLGPFVSKPPDCADSVRFS